MYAVNGLLDCLAPFVVPIGNTACWFLTCWTSLLWCGWAETLWQVFSMLQRAICIFSNEKHKEIIVLHASVPISIKIMQGLTAVFFAIWPIRKTKQWFCLSYRTYDQDTIIFVEMQQAYWWKWSNLVEWHYSHFVIGDRTSILKVTYRGEIELNMRLSAFPFHFFFSELYRHLRVMNSETLWLIAFLCCFTQKEGKSCIHIHE